MFERRDPVNWKIPVLIITGISVLGGGIYLGVKSVNTEEKEVNASQTIEKQANEKEVFSLSKDCEIWVYQKNEDGSDSSEGPMMIGTVDEELLNKSEEEITTYLKEKYPERELESLSKYEIILSEVSKVNDVTRKNKYSLEEDGEFIGLYRYDDNGNRELVEKTQIKTGSLPNSVQEQIKNGIIVDSQEQAYTWLEGFGS